jgi:hypothetical protein
MEGQRSYLSPDLPKRRATTCGLCRDGRLPGLKTVSVFHGRNPAADGWLAQTSQIGTCGPEFF